jgi:hypothetical protein
MSDSDPSKRTPEQEEARQRAIKALAEVVRRRYEAQGHKVSVSVIEDDAA